MPMISWQYGDWPKLSRVDRASSGKKKGDLLLWTFVDKTSLHKEKEPDGRLDRGMIDSNRRNVKKLGLMIGFIIGCAMLVAAFGIGSPLVMNIHHA